MAKRGTSGRRNTTADTDINLEEKAAQPAIEGEVEASSMEEKQPDKPAYTENVGMQEMIRFMEQLSKKMEEDNKKSRENNNKKIETLIKQMEENTERFCQKMDEIINDGKQWKEELIRK